MILRELFYKDNSPVSNERQDRYSAEKDFLMPVNNKDTRKTRLTLKQINELRIASEKHILEQEKELEFIEQMYKAAPAPAV